MRKNIIFISLFLHISLFAKDKIIKSTGEVIECKITDIGEKHVEYHYSDNNKINFSIEKKLRDKLMFSSREETSLMPEYSDDSSENTYDEQNKRALKISFLSPLFGYTEFTYEKSLYPSRSWEVAIGLIGLGSNSFGISPRGVYAKYAYKFIRSPEYYTNRMDYAHVLKGMYLAPEIALRYYSYDLSYFNTEKVEYDIERIQSYGFALLIKVGKQWIFNDKLLIDLSAGLGYGIGEIGGDEYDFNTFYTYGFKAGLVDFPIASSLGIRIGWLF